MEDEELLNDFLKKKYSPKKDSRFTEPVGSIASGLDFEDYANSNDEVGNWLTSLTESWKQETNEEFPIYRETPGKTFDVSDSGWWIENGSSLVNSVGGFAIGGGIISK